MDSDLDDKPDDMGADQLKVPRKMVSVMDKQYQSTKNVAKEGPGMNSNHLKEFMRMYNRKIAIKHGKFIQEESSSDEDDINGKGKAAKNMNNKLRKKFEKI